MSPHVLFVDDEAPIREMLSLYFRKQGWQVTSAVTPAEAKDRAAGGRFDVAIVDVDLAGENGLELLGYFKSQHAQMPVIIFSGLAGDDLAKQALAAGANGFMRKTESLGTLFAEVNRHLPKS